MTSRLYHGTKCSAAILAEDILRVAPFGERCVSLSRSFDVAAYFARLDRDGPGVDGRPAVLVLDGDRLRQDYAVEARPVSDWIDDDSEEEESVWTDIAGLSRYLVGVREIEEDEPVRDFSPDEAEWTGRV